MNWITQNLGQMLLKTSRFDLAPMRAASKKTGGSTRNTHPKVRPKHRGWKVQDGHQVQAGHILVTQRTLRFHPGLNGYCQYYITFETPPITSLLIQAPVGLGRNGTLFAIIPGKVVVTCEKVDLNWDHTWVQRCHGHRKGTEFFKKYFNVIPEPQHQNFRLIDEI